MLLPRDYDRETMPYRQDQQHADRREHDHESEPFAPRGQPGCEDRSVRFDDDREGQQQPCACLAARRQPHDCEHRKRGEEQIDLTEHKLVRVELCHRGESHDDEQDWRFSDLRQRSNTQPEQRKHQERGCPEPCGFRGLARNQREWRRQQRERRQILELKMPVFSPIEPRPPVIK